uniref:Uncharacterized protein n=1 Tax=Setaria digitata TaxID=48799 RepID=A0A915PM66_9BILA
MFTLSGDSEGLSNFVCDKQLPKFAINDLQKKGMEEKGMSHGPHSSMFSCSYEIKYHLESNQFDIDLTNLSLAGSVTCLNCKAEIIASRVQWGNVEFRPKIDLKNIIGS